jgi:hypothetical protein
MNAYRDSDYWVGSLAMTIALASKEPDPQPVLKNALREFLQDRPPGNELGDLLRITLGKGKT